MRTNAKRTLIIIQLAALLVATLALGRPTYRFVKRSVASAKAGTQWRDWKSDPANAERAPTSGDPALWLRVPKAGIDSLVLFDGSDGNLQRHPCIHDAGAETGSPTIIMAHRDYQFRKLDRLEVGGRFDVEDAAGKKVRYRVSDIEIVEPEQLEATIDRPCRDARLALLTCYPFDFTGPAPQRILFWAEPLGE